MFDTVGAAGWLVRKLVLEMERGVRSHLVVPNASAQPAATNDQAGVNVRPLAGGDIQRPRQQQRDELLQACPAMRPLSHALVFVSGADARAVTLLVEARRTPQKV